MYQSAEVLSEPQTQEQTGSNSDKASSVDINAETSNLSKPFYSLEWTAFSERLITAGQGLYVGDISATEFESLELSDIADNITVIVVAKMEGKPYYELFSNLALNASLSTTEDIAPTILTQLGCNASANNYSIGQALQQPSRAWSVSTQGRHLVVLHKGLLTEVSTDGSFEIRDYMTNEKVLTEIDTNLLSRSIKHITEFSKR
jgi:membrane-anchored protein YejM (alkaline phosphatase superfamily)